MASWLQTLPSSPQACQHWQLMCTARGSSLGCTAMQAATHVQATPAAGEGALLVICWQTARWQQCMLFLQVA
jgi:hypothetical protein